MCDRKTDIHPVDALYATACRLAFLADVFSQPNNVRFEFGQDSQFGLNLILHDLRDEVKRIENQLQQQEEVTV
jgi:hypothetical protein